MLEEFFLEILNMSFTGSIVILFVLLTRLLLKKTPKIFSYALWSVVLFRLISPFSFESMFSLIPTKASPISQDIVYMQTPKIDTGITLINNTVNGLLPAATPSASINPLQFWLFIGSAVWVIGIIIMLSYSLYSLLSLKKKLTNAIPYTDNIFLSHKIDTAFVLGILRPKIYLPDNLTDGQREHILLHEQTHIKRFDHIVKLFSFFVLCLHWFNPLAWVAYFVSSKDMEMSCDEAVVKKLGSKVKKDYSTSLLTLATGRRMVGGTPLAFGEGDTKERIKNVLNYKKPAFWVIFVAAIAVVCIIMGLISNPKQGDTVLDSVHAVILEIDKDNQSMTVKGSDENSIIGDRCIVTWEENALITLATSSKPTQLTLDDFSVGDVVVLSIGEVKESYPTRAIASSIELQPKGTNEPNEQDSSLASERELYFWIKPDESEQVIGDTAAMIWLKSLMEADTPIENRITDYKITDVTVITKESKQGVKWEDMDFQYVVQVTYDITTANEQYTAPGDNVLGKGTFQNLSRELFVKVKPDDGGGYYIVSIVMGGTLRETA